MEQEIWKDVDGYEDIYQVSSHGRVKRVAGQTTRVQGNGRIVVQPVKERVLKPTPNVKSGYLNVNLCRDGKPELKAVHVMTAAAFVDFPEQLRNEAKVYVCHNDGDPSNCHHKNLRYDTPKGNLDDRHKHGTHSVGEQNPSVAYTTDDVLVIHDLLRTMNSREIHDLTGIPKSTIRGIQQGRAWGHVPSPYSTKVVFE